MEGGEERGGAEGGVMGVMVDLDEVLVPGVEGGDERGSAEGGVMGVIVHSERGVAGFFWDGIVTEGEVGGAVAVG